MASPEKSNTTPKYPGIQITTNGNQLVALHTEARLADAGIFYPITPSTEMGENFELSFAKGELNVFGNPKIAIEAEGEHAAQGGAIAYSVTGKRVVNFTSGQGVAYGLEQYYHAPGKLSTMVVELASRPFTKHALNVHCGHDDVYCAMDTGWIILFAKDAQQAADQALIIRKVTELSLTPGMNGQDGFLTSHLERTFHKHEAGLIREFLGRADDIIPCPTEAQKELFGPERRRVPEFYDLKNPVLIGPVQNQEHYMNGIVARRNNFVEPILGFLEESYQEFGKLTGRYYGFISEFNTKKADTVFVSLGSSAENIEAAIDYIRERDGVEVGCIHMNVLRPFPEAAIVNALKGKKNVIILEKSDDQCAGDNPLTRDIRTAFMKSLENSSTLIHKHLPPSKANEIPLIYSGVYGLGSRDFRPEGILGAYEFACKDIKRHDGKSAKDGESFFYIGVDHPYAVISKDRPSLLPDKAIAIRFHSIGGWGAITTGKNLSEILGEIGHFASERDYPGQDKELVHISANPKYGSEKKGSPTNYFLVAAPERVRVNCDLHHVNVVLCCDPKAFTHTNPIMGLSAGGALIWQSSEVDHTDAWQRIPVKFRKEIIEKEIKVYILDGFKIAEEATPRKDLQLRMQGNSFLGAFFKVSSFLQDYKIEEKEFQHIVEDQYKKKFGKLGDAVVASNMTVMTKGFDQVRELPYGDINAPDTSTFRGFVTLPCADCGPEPSEEDSQVEMTPMTSRSKFDTEYMAGLGYSQPSTALASVGVMPAATGKDLSKFVARRLIPKYKPENCTQCMDCITACPDTALPNTAQEIGTILSNAVKNYVSTKEHRVPLLKILDKVEEMTRATLVEEAKNKGKAEAFHRIAMRHMKATIEEEKDLFKSNNIDKSLTEIETILQKIPAAYSQVNAIFTSKEKKAPGEGGLFSIFVSDLCKGCGQCVIECGDHDALEMVEETEVVNAHMHTGIAFLRQLPDTASKYLGLYNADAPQDSRAAALQFHLMQRSVYESLVSGDGACAGCGEKTILHVLATLTEAYMRPIFHSKAERLIQKVTELKKDGTKKLDELSKKNPEGYAHFKKTLLHVLMGFGGESEKDTNQLIEEGFKGGDREIIDALVMILETDAFNHKDLQTVKGLPARGMSVMGMTANTGCSTVYGSTPPSNPHPYPWMNSLFQDGTTIGWLVAESFIVNHARRSVMPERFADSILSDFTSSLSPLTEEDYFVYTHFTDNHMTDDEIREMPKVWAIGGDGGMGDIGFQNLSKSILQNRPNFKALMLDTQVYSNTGGQNSDSSVLPGGFDMNQFGKASQGKLTERKEVSQILSVGHGSPFIGQVSMANAANLFKTILDALQYRGASFLQCFTTCQPEHGVGDSESTMQAQLARDSRGMVEFVFNPTLGESDEECLSIKGNPNPKRDWYQKMVKATRETYNFTVAHWAITEGRFRNHIKKAPADCRESCIFLDDILVRVMQQDVIHRNVFNSEHHAYIPPLFGVYANFEQPDGSMKPFLLSRQMVIFCVERRKNWRMIQGRAGIINEDYEAQKAVLSKFHKGEISKEDLFAKGIELLENEKKKLEEKPVSV